jgi:hypothetical protein
MVMCFESNSSNNLTVVNLLAILQILTTNSNENLQEIKLIIPKDRLSKFSSKFSIKFKIIK